MSDYVLLALLVAVIAALFAVSFGWWALLVFLTLLTAGFTMRRTKETR